MELRERIEKLKQRQKGFTLVELIVVVAIIGILAGVMLPRYFSFTDDARKGVAISEAKSIRTIAETYYAKKGDWPEKNTDDLGTNEFKVGDDDTIFTGTLTGLGEGSGGSFLFEHENGMFATCAPNGTVTEGDTYDESDGDDEG